MPRTKNPPPAEAPPITKKTESMGEIHRRIDTARDVLVGKVPDPKSQVEQITLALIYKFMDDMDDRSVEIGGSPSFFKGDAQRFAWKHLFDPRLGSADMLKLYDEAISSFSASTNLPELFRNIYKNAYLPYRDPETLKLFLKTINGFHYDHSERLGDAFEYLLSVLGSQGDAGQFRTPRHIIDFIVKVVDPGKDDKILDPACGTAGFLISAFKHVIHPHTFEHASKSGDLRKVVRITPQEKAQVMRNIRGYDISPDMVRLSLVNLYLHGFAAPEVMEYDALTSDDHWNDYYDVILANPPFMSPKGGIKPHKRFGVQSNRSEVLFVDYIAEHLKPKGRAGIIVPEGIIFQSGNAYKELRKLLVDKFLWAVVSLPAGVFNPYSGVKTSILFLDRARAEKSDSILFVKVQADGFDLGAQRRPNGKDDLPGALQVLANPNPPKADSDLQYLIVPKAQLTASGDYNLSMDRYQPSKQQHSGKWPMVKLGDVAELVYGFTASAAETGDARFIRITDIDEAGGLRPDEAKYVTISSENQDYLLVQGDILVARTGATYGKTVLFNERYKAIFASYLIRIRFPEGNILPEFFWNFAQTDFYWTQAKNLVTGGGQPQFNGNAVKEITIPLPQLEVQREIVAEIEGYRRVLDGAKQVVDNYKPNVEFFLRKYAPTPGPSPKPGGGEHWPMVKLGEVCEDIQYGISEKLNTDDKGYKIFRMNEIINGRMFDNGSMKHCDISRAEFDKYKLKKGDILFNRTNSYELVGKTGIYSLDGDHCFASYLIRLVPNISRVAPEYVNAFMNTEPFQAGIKQFATKAIGQSNINATSLSNYAIPLPPLATQQAIVADIEQERALVESNRELAHLMQAKIKAVVERVWAG